MLEIETTMDERISATSSANNESDFTSSSSQLLVGEDKFILRVLKMNRCTMLFVSNAASECLDEMAVAMPMLPSSEEVLGTTLLGPHITSDSQRLAEKLSKRFGRQFFVSYNIQLDRLGGPLLEQQLNAYVRSHREEFA